MAVSGKPLSPEMKRTIVTLKGYFDRNKADLKGFASAQLTADALELSRVTVDRVMRDYRKDSKSLDSPPKLRGKPSYAVDASNQEMVRAYVRKANLEGSYITLETIRDHLLERSPEEQFSIRTLSGALDRWGFEFGKGVRTQHLKEKDAERRGHTVLRTPPYHPELQPIEICWGVVKNEVGRNCTFTMQNLENQLDEAFKKVTSETCNKIIRRIRQIEDKFWEEDAKMDRLLEGGRVGQFLEGEEEEFDEFE